jgi:hypothetical protein
MGCTWTLSSSEIKNELIPLEFEGQLITNRDVHEGYNDVHGDCRFGFPTNDNEDDVYDDSDDVLIIIAIIIYIILVFISRKTKSAIAMNITIRD